MSSQISLSEQYIWVANARLGLLVSLALEVATAENNDADGPYIRSLATFEASMWPGIKLDLGAVFPALEAKKYWARIFSNVARRVFLRELGHHESTHWQSSTIGDAYIISRMLTRAVQEVEQAWHPETENSAEASGRLSIRV